MSVERPNSRDGFLVTLSASGQITVPAPLREIAKSKGVRKYRVRVIDTSKGSFTVEPVPTVAEALAPFVREYDPPLTETFRQMKEEDAELYEW